MKTRTLFATGVALFLGLWVASASALVITIDTGNLALGCCTGPYATVTVTRVDNFTANIVFNSLTNGGYLYRMGDGGTADLSVNGAYTLGAVAESGTTGGFTPTYLSNTPGNVNGFGFFSLSLNNVDGFTDSATQISFQITNTTGLWLTDALVLAANANGAVAAVHSYACSTAGAGCTTATGAFATGLAAGSGGSTPPREIPEPGVLALLSIGLLSLGVTAIRQRRKS